MVSPVRGTNLWEIKYEGGGVTPLPLRGRYTTQTKAEEAVERFLELN